MILTDHEPDLSAVYHLEKRSNENLRKQIIDLKENILHQKTNLQVFC
tara:strand:- start:100049 stop:100189 length:141 start_codon:yes stop_codon:yes gene_type:complete